MNIKRYSNIDQLRFLAAITVALSHLIIAKNGSNLKLEISSSIAVEVCFIISGFVLAPQILRVINSKELKNYKIFLIRRWYRTIPLYFLSLALTSLLLGKFLSFDFFKYLIFFQNFYKIIVNVDYFSISWSLSVEEWFYEIFQIFIFFFLRFSKAKENKNIIYLSFLFIGLIFFLRIFFLTEDNWGSNIRRIVLFRLDAIVFGFILYFYKDFIVNKILNTKLLFIFILITSFMVFKILEINSLQNIIIFKIIFHYLIALWGSVVVLFFYSIDQKIKKEILIKINLFFVKSHTRFIFSFNVNIYYYTLYRYNRNDNTSLFNYSNICIIIAILLL